MYGVCRFVLAGPSKWNNPHSGWEIEILAKCLCKGRGKNKNDKSDIRRTFAAVKKKLVTCFICVLKKAFLGCFCRFWGVS
jgi:hypothetical protein